jgi:hypothetical protein
LYEQQVRVVLAEEAAAVATRNADMRRLRHDQARYEDAQWNSQQAILRQQAIHRTQAQEQLRQQLLRQDAEKKQQQETLPPPTREPAASIVTELSSSSLVQQHNPTQCTELVIILTEEANMGELNEIFHDNDNNSPSSSSHEFAASNPMREQEQRQSQGEGQVRLEGKEHSSLEEAEDAPPPSLQTAVQSLPQSLAESADAVQSCPAGGGMVEVSLIIAQEFVLVFSSKVWDPGGPFQTGATEDGHATRLRHRRRDGRMPTV